MRIKIISNIKSIKKNKYDLINFGSSIQYIDNFFKLFDSFDLKKVKNILITHTPLSLEHTSIKKQWNYKDLYHNVYSLSDIEKFFKKKKFKLVFKSRFPYRPLQTVKEKQKVFNANLLFSKQ